MGYMKHAFFILTCLFSTITLQGQNPETYNEFVIIIPTYNAIEWYRKCLDSVLMQDYPEDKVKVYVIDDCSTDGQVEAIEDYIVKYDTKNWIRLIKNKQKWWAAGNRWKAGHWCSPDAVIVDVDGDDWLFHDKVLQRLNEEYNKGDVLVTWGQWQSYPKGKKGTCRAIPAEVLKEKKLRSFHASDLHDYEFAIGHLRTYKAWLFQQIKLKDFLFEGQFYTASCDVQIMLSVLEMAQEQSSFICDVLYIYNCVNPLSDWRTKLAAQRDINNHIRSKKPYPRIEKKPIQPSFEVSMVVLAESPLGLAPYLESVAKNVKNLTSVFILMPSNYQNYTAYQKTKEAFKHYTYIDYDQNELKDTLLTVLEKCNDFVVLATEQAPFFEMTNLVAAARSIHKVHAHAFYAPTKKLKKFFAYTKCLVPINEGDTAAWQYRYAKNQKSSRLAIAGTLYRKNVIVDCVQQHTVKELKDLERALIQDCEEDDLGLVYQSFVKGLVPEPKTITSSYLALNWYTILLVLSFSLSVGIFVVRPSSKRLP